MRRKLQTVEVCSPRMAVLNLISKIKLLKTLKFKFLVILVLFFLNSCINLFDPGLKKTQQRLVVESQLTTRLENQYVYLTYDAGYNGEETNFKFLVKRAKVSISDNKGKEYEFEDDVTQSNQIKPTDGYNYVSKEKFKAEIGNTYTLKIETTDGKKYESLPEALVQVPKISKVFSEFKSGAPTSKIAGNFDIYIQTKDPSDTKNYYMWRSYGVKQLNYCREWFIYGQNEADTQSFIDKCCE